MKRAIAVVPASTANLGAGFDTLSLALKLYNRVELQEAERGWRVEIEGEGAEELPRDETHLTVQAARRAFRLAGRPVSGLRLRAANSIPLASGLGSSAAAVVGGLAAANALTGGALTQGQLLEAAAQMEGHADNAAASLFGGLNVVSRTNRGWLARQIPIPALEVTVVLPQIKLATPEMRRALPSAVPLEDAVFNLGRSLLTVEALRRGDMALLRQAMEDRLHQPYRKRHIPGFDAALRAAEEAGAAAVALSGAGPSLVAFSEADPSTIGEAMTAALGRAGLDARYFVTGVDFEGVQVTLEGA